ncbi:EAL domain-containing protein [Phormidium sp. FACHB-592]|uniref:EAL domain-containing protein n=2 Tax=Stenomitos TaxID=1844270 RepID=A0ABV0KJ73_9CYAN|nr:EAL domain-containing protein [Phormidium sp. FACHB-592]MBD2074811.1 EAL domain-containing protein [Phormidium sp. FACHB-592]
MNSTDLDGMRADILIVDDTPLNLRLLSNILTKAGYQVRQALSGEMALRAVQALPPDLLLLDIMMPSMDGYTLCQTLKENSATASIPVVFLSALSDGLDKAKAFAVGGADYITKPFHLEEVLARVQNQLALKAAQYDNQQLNAQLEARVKERTHQLEIANRELYREVLERKVLQAQLLEMAHHDALTGLPNRAFFLDRTKQALDAVKADQTSQFAVLFLDCDRFKVVNDSLGHFMGDQLLLAIARRLRALLPTTITLARLGGDEFTMLLPRFTDQASVIQIVKQILNAFAQPFQLDQHEVFITASIGIAIGTAEYSLPEHLLRDADMAMYRAKASGSAPFQVFDPTLHQTAIQRLQLEIDLRKALYQQELVVHYQPILALTTSKLVGFEALVRWHHPQKGLVSPAVFIPIAEETGLITQIGHWVLKRSCQQLQQWQAEKRFSAPLTMSVNLSARQFTQPDLVEQIDQILAETQLNPRYLKLEITESAIMRNAEATTSVLQELRKRHIQLSIDDFGTGYSSLSYLHSFPVDTLKIDQSFVQQMGENADSLGLVPLIINIAQKMGMTVVAEGVETQTQLDHLKALNCDFGQGFFFCKPLEADKISALLASKS